MDIEKAFKYTKVIEKPFKYTQVKTLFKIFFSFVFAKK